VHNDHAFSIGRIERKTEGRSKLAQVRADEFSEEAIYPQIPPIDAD
jgi:hypothetical protein